MEQRKPNPEFIDAYNVLLECLVRLNLIHPGCRARLDRPENENDDPNPVNRDWVNRIVERVVALRKSHEDDGARAIIDQGNYRASDDSVFYRCVCLRSDGAKERVDETPIVDPVTA